MEKEKEDADYERGMHWWLTMVRLVVGKENIWLRPDLDKKTLKYNPYNGSSQVHTYVNYYFWLENFWKFWTGSLII